MLCWYSSPVDFQSQHTSCLNFILTKGFASMKNGQSQAQWLTALISEFTLNAPENSLGLDSGERAFDAPLVGFSSGGDELYTFYRQQFPRSPYLHVHHWQTLQHIQISPPMKASPGHEVCHSTSRRDILFHQEMSWDPDLSVYHPWTRPRTVFRRAGQQYLGHWHNHPEHRVLQQFVAAAKMLQQL